MNPEALADTMDMDTLQSAFIQAVKDDIEPEQSFKTEDGYRWKFLAEKDNVFVARHGELTAVMTLTHLKGSEVSVSLELKETPE